MRTRTQDSTTRVTDTRLITLTNGVETSNSHYNLAYIVGDGQIGEMSDVVTPRYRRMSGRGQIINNDLSSDQASVSFPGAPYDFNTYTLDKANNSVTTQRQWSTKPLSAFEFVENGFFFSRSAAQRSELLDSLPTPETLSRDQVLVRALAKANETDVLALVSIAEARKTVDSMSRAAAVMQRISRYAKKLKPKDFTPQGAVRQTANGLKVWLEVRYGLLPTIYDVVGYTEYARNVGRRARWRFTSESSATCPVPYVTSENEYTFYRLTRNMNRTRSRTVSAGCLIEPFAENLDPVHSLGIDRIGSTAWELVPLSFVVDWFFNTSQTLAAHEGRFGQRMLASWSTIRDEVFSTYQHITVGRHWENPNWEYHGYGLNTFGATERFKRTVRIANPDVPLLPSTQIRLDWKKLVDIAGIAASTSQGLRRLRL